MTINDNKRRKKLTIFFFGAAIVFLVVVLSSKHLWAVNEIWPFFLAIGFFLVALLIFCIVKLNVHSSSLAKLDKGLSLDEFSKLHNSLMQKKLNRQGFINQNVNIFRTVLKGSMPSFVQQRLNDVILRIEHCTEEVNESDLMSTTSASIPHETSWRFLGHFFVNALLFIGIIGTFYGLITVFSDQNIINLVTSIKSDHNIYSNLDKVFVGFYEAFGSSLIAYISYIFGRVMLEMLDTDHDALGQFLEQRIGDFVTICFPPKKAEPPRIELPEELKIVLEKSANSLDKLSKNQGDLVKRFDQTVNRYEKIGDRIIKALFEGRKEWKAAAETWQSTTKTWTNTTNTFIGQSNTLISNLQTNVDKLVEYNDKFTETWNKRMGELHQNLVQQFEKYNKALTKLDAEITTHISEFEKTRELVTDLAKQIETGRIVLLGTAKTIIEEEKNSRQLYADQLRQTFERHIEERELFRVYLEQDQKQLTAINNAIRRLDRVFMGQEGTPDDLLSVLRDLRDNLGINLPENNR